MVSYLCCWFAGQRKKFLLRRLQVLTKVRLCLAIISQAPAYKESEEAEVNAALRLITALQLIRGPINSFTKITQVL